jgi:general secretion pathway protein I
MTRNRAFTLLEVLAALMIFIVAAVVFGASYLNVLNSYEAAARSNIFEGDVAFARSQLLTISDLTAAQAGAEFDDGDRHVKWTSEIEPTNTTDLFTVTFTCVISAPDQSGGQKTVTETFMLLRPTWSDPTARTKLVQNAADRIAQIQGKQPQ